MSADTIQPRPTLPSHENHRVPRLSPVTGDDRLSGHESRPSSLERAYQIYQNTEELFRSRDAAPPIAYHPSRLSHQFPPIQAGKPTTDEYAIPPYISVIDKQNTPHGSTQQLVRNQQGGGSSPLAGSITTLQFVKDLQRPPMARCIA